MEKLKIFRSHLVFSLSHHLASVRILKECFTELDTECRNFLGLICNLPNHVKVPFFYEDRRVARVAFNIAQFTHDIEFDLVCIWISI